MMVTELFWKKSKKLRRGKTLGLKRNTTKSEEIFLGDITEKPIILGSPLGPKSQADIGKKMMNWDN